MPQEQRIAELSRRAATVRDELSKVEANSIGATSELKRIESTLDRMPADVRRTMDETVDMLKNQLVAAEKRRQDLANEESMLSQQIAADQGRWTDVNNQLDQIERSLTLPIKQ